MKIQQVWLTFTEEPTSKMVLGANYTLNLRSLVLIMVGAVKSTHH